MFGIILIGLQQGIKALPTTVFLTSLSWFTDILDGSLARKSERPTRLGHLDVIVDVGLALALALFLVLGGIILLVPVIVVIALTILISWLSHSTAPRKLMMGVSYGTFIFVVWQKDVQWFLFLIGSVLLFMLFFPKRTREQISDFLGDAANIVHRGHAIKRKNHIGQK